MLKTARDVYLAANKNVKNNIQTVNNEGNKSELRLISIKQYNNLLKITKITKNVIFIVARIEKE